MSSSGPMSQHHPQELTAEDVRHLASLARIRLTEEEIEHFRRQLSTVIESNMSVLSEVDVSQVEPTAQTTGLSNVWRSDQPQPSLSSDQALSQAPVKRHGQFAVPPVLGES